SSMWRVSRRRLGLPRDVSSRSIRYATISRVQVIFPHAEPTHEGVAVVPQPRSGRNSGELFNVPAAQGDLIDDTGGLETVDHVLDTALPFLAPQSIQAALAYVILDRSALAIGQMR